MKRTAIPGVTADPVAPFVSELRDKALVLIPTRLVLRGPPAAVAQAEAALLHLDRPRPAVAVRITVAEVRHERRFSYGGHASFDRDARPGTPRTFFRGTASAFEPNAWLRSQLVGAVPFVGTELTFGRNADTDGPLDLVLRALAHRQEADLLVQTTLVATEGSPASLASRVVLPSLIVPEAHTTLRLSTEPLETGLTLELLATRVSPEGAVLDLKVRVVTAEPSPEPDVLPGSLVLRARELSTRVTVRDAEPVALGGLVLRRWFGDRKRIPLLDLVPALDVPLSSQERESGSTELLFVLHPRLLLPGNGDRLPRSRTLDPGPR